MNAKIDCMFDKIIQEATKELQDALNSTAESLVSSENMRLELINENKELKNTIAKYQLVSEVESLFTEDNFESMLPLFKLKSNNFDLYGMYSEEVPNWFKYLYHYYEDRERLFNLMDLFNIKYPTWAKNYKMPYDYNEEELELFLSPEYRRSMCNGQYLSGNIGFFWKNVHYCCGSTQKILENKSSFTDEIPYQLILANTLWRKDSLFANVIESIKKGRCNAEYFFAIQDYNTISEDQIRELIKVLPKERIFDIHKKFICKNLPLVKESSYFDDNFKGKIESNHYSIFYYLNYSVESQKEFIRGYEGYGSKFDLIKKMDIPDEEKIKFSMEFLGDKV